MRIAAVGEAFPENYYAQGAITDRLRQLWGRDATVTSRLDSLHRNVEVDGRYLSLPLEAYTRDRSFGQTNDVWIETALNLGERAIASALGDACLVAQDIDAIFFSTVTGVASPSLDARLVNRMGFRTDIRRTPMFGLGCVAGAAGLSRAADYLRGNPTHTAIVLTVELCSLTLQFDDRSVAT